MNAETLTNKIVSLLRNCDLPISMESELALERKLGPIIRNLVKDTLKINDEVLSEVVFSHGETRAEKEFWTKSKADQNVVVYGCSNTGDIFIKHPDGESIYIEVKLSKRRGPKSTSLPGDIQRSIGQSLIASLRHAFVICFIVCQGDLRARPDDLRNELEQTLWQRHRIALIVRELGE